ncbi:heterokaryon incompatibility protein-domain-containing protein [Dactylonectria estremocensis]|uniref:Heterokaryon incompatibility protein-domain-containing protein n=1 Tax=Dactylonectria estremocensis TaxID=1079267 RepID=A0A9P9IRI2_9HYPO|nr:heterokaryon incompatibility protein-domain-containing protein [Dactylonectria estremocensis]
MGSAKWSPVFEEHVAEDTLVDLHHLCASCSRLPRGSTLLQGMARGAQLRLHTKERFHLCSVKDLKGGYLSGCHLCALLWTHGGGHRLDPDQGLFTETDINLCLEARSFDMEYALEFQTSGFQKWWSKLVLPPIGELGVICVSISKIYNGKTRPLDMSNKLYELFIYPSSSGQLNKATFRQGLEPISSKSDLKLAQIKSWYRQCCEIHARCTAYPQMVAPGSQRPSRLLDIDGNKIRLECNVESLPQLQYATLSHMWGPDPSVCLQLTISQLHDFESDIPLSLLPTKYLEAIRIAKSLGFRYIWIDSLCIIQDSEEDWKKEALKMATVYGRTALNISYVYPPSEKPSQQHLRDPRVIVPCRLPMDHLQRREVGSSENATSLIVQGAPGYINKFWSPTTYKQVWPLLSRAWVFQERLLCSRNIYYGQDRLLWECCQGLDDEFSGPLVDSPRSKTRFHSVFAGIQGDSLGRQHDESFKGQWGLLVEEYRLANLTFEKDRIIAFAGIVKAVQSQTKFTYLAGIWKEFAELDLLWVIHPPSPLGDFYDRRNEMRQHVPSWSWFSVPTRLQSAPTTSDTVDFRIRTELYNRSFHTVYKAHIISFQYPKLASNPDAHLYDFASLNITLKTRLIACTLEWDGPVLRILPNGHPALGKDKYLEPKNAMKYVHDDVSLLPGSSVPTEACMILTTFEAWVLRGKRDHRYDTYVASGDETSTSWQYAGLVVVPAGKSSTGQDSWQRIGVFMFADFVDELGVIEIPFPMEEEEQEVCLV